MAEGIRFYNVIWNTGNGFSNTTEASHSRRYLFNQIKKNDLKYFSESGKPWEMVKIQEIETPMIELEYFAEMFAKYGNKAGREAHEQQTSYVLNLIRTKAARVRINQDEFIER